MSFYRPPSTSSDAIRGPGGKVTYGFKVLQSYLKTGLGEPEVLRSFSCVVHYYAFGIFYVRLTSCFHFKWVHAIHSSDFQKARHWPIFRKELILNPLLKQLSH